MKTKKDIHICIYLSTISFTIL